MLSNRPRHWYSIGTGGDGRGRACPFLSRLGRRFLIDRIEPPATGGFDPFPALFRPSRCPGTLSHVERITVDLAKDWLSVADLCEYMDVSPFVITRVLRSGELPAVKMGREWRVSRTDFEDWLNAQRFAASLEAKRQTR